MYTIVSIIITTRNTEKDVRRLLRSIKKQTYKELEVILVDNNSGDNTKKNAEKFNVDIFNFGPERSAQRNFGAKNAKGNYLLFLDADMALSKNVVKECVQFAKNNRDIGGVIIPEVSIAVRFWEKVKAFERSFYNEKGDNITDAIRFFPKEVFKRIKGYDEALTGPEDWDISDRVQSLGYTIGRIKSKINHYERIGSLWTLLKKKFYYGLDAHKYIEKQKVPMFGPKTIYFFRPVFYKNLDKFSAHPILSLGMFTMLLFELLSGGAGYLLGRIKKL